MKKRFKTLLSLVLIVSVLFSTTIIAFSKDDVLTGEANYGFTCELDKNTGVLTIGGLGMLFAGDIESALGLDSLSFVKEIVIKEGVSLIDLCGWFNQPDFSNVKTLSIPSTMKRILGDTFVNCTSLEKVNYGGSAEDWLSVKIDDGNDAVKNAIVNYNCSIPVTEGYENFNYSFVIEKMTTETVCKLDCYTGVVTVSPKVNNAEIGFVEGNLGELFDIPTNSFDGYYVDYLGTTVVFEEGITKIGTDILRSKTIKELYLPKSLVEVGDDCFGNSQHTESVLEKVYYAGDEAEWKNISIGINNYPLIIADRYYGDSVSKKELTYTLSKTNFVFNGKQQYPTVTVKDKYGNILEENVDYYLVYGYDRYETGKVKIEIHLMGEYEGVATKYYYIRAKAPVVKSAVSRKDGLTVTWLKNDTSKNGWIDGYEIQYSKSPKFTSSKTITLKNRNSYAKKIMGLNSGSTYYVRVRAITFENGGYIRSAWSNVKSVKAG